MKSCTVVIAQAGGQGGGTGQQNADRCSSF